MTLMDLNLLPSGAKFQAAKVKLQKKIRTAVVAIVSVWVGVAIVIFGLTIVIKLRTTTVEAQFKRAQSDYLAMSDNIVTSQTLKYRAKIVGEVLANRFEYGKAFEEINSLFPPEVKITNFKLKDRGGFQISAETSGSVNMDKVETIIADINNSQNDKFKDAKMTSLTYSEGGWVFAMEVGLK
jgi:Tfp pilus assembly protein PilN